MSDLEHDRQEAVKKYLNLILSEEFLDDDNKAIQEAAQLKAKIESIDFDLMSPKQQFHKRIQDALDKEG
jgi:hypothetical protein